MFVWGRMWQIEDIGLVFQVQDVKHPPASVPDFPAQKVPLTTFLRPVAPKFFERRGCHAARSQFNCPPRDCVQAQDNTKPLEQKLDMLAMAMGSNEKVVLQVRGVGNAWRAREEG